MTRGGANALRVNSISYSLFFGTPRGLCGLDRRGPGLFGRDGRRDDRRRTDRSGHGGRLPHRGHRRRALGGTLRRRAGPALRLPEESVGGFEGGGRPFVSSVAQE